jgi:hypothetical protein
VFIAMNTCDKLCSCSQENDSIETSNYSWESLKFPKLIFHSQSVLEI